jgi:hypothetical protein
MKITELLLAELDREAVGSRKTLERVPEGKNDWKLHEKSMPLGYLATIVATIPAWLDMMVNKDELDINPPGGSKYKPQEWKTRRAVREQPEERPRSLAEHHGRSAVEHQVADAVGGQVDDGADAV